MPLNPPFFNVRLTTQVFRSSHASNYLMLKGVLNKDKAKLLQTVDQAIIHQPGSVLAIEKWEFSVAINPRLF